MKRPLANTYANGLGILGAPGMIRTCDPLVRSQVLYPAELRAHAEHYIASCMLMKVLNGYFVHAYTPLLVNRNAFYANDT